MAKITTEELIESFLSSRSDDMNCKRVRGQIARPELFKYEEKIGKQLVEMNVDEIIEMFKTFNVSTRSLQQLSSYYRMVVDYYAFNYELVANPFHRKELRGMDFLKKVTEDNKKFSVDDMEYAISRIHSTHSDSIPKIYYLECIVRLFYDGFMNAAEIVDLKKSDINFDTRKVKVSNREITLSERTMMLLIYVNNMDEISSTQQTYEMISWNGSFFKFPTRKNNVSKFLMYDKATVSNVIYRKILREINKDCEVNVDYLKLYYLGVFNKFVEKCGSEEKAKDMVYNNTQEYSDFILEFISEMNLTVQKSAFLKAYFREFI